MDGRRRNWPKRSSAGSELHYQPVVDLRSGGIVGAEALLRWRHPTLGLLPPGQFLPVVESSGLMPEIGAWVLGEACRQMRDWRMLAWRPFRLAVNVSASQVGPDFDGWVKGVLADAELPAEYLEIELTESFAFGDPAIFPPWTPCGRSVCASPPMTSTGIPVCNI